MIKQTTTADLPSPFESLGHIREGPNGETESDKFPRELKIQEYGFS